MCFCEIPKKDKMTFKRRPGDSKTWSYNSVVPQVLEELADWDDFDTVFAAAACVEGHGYETSVGIVVAEGTQPAQLRVFYFLCGFYLYRHHCVTYDGIHLHTVAGAPIT